MYKKAKAHFKKHDPILHEAARGFDIADVAASGDLFNDIVWTIIGQQLSSRAADTIFARFRKLFPRGRISAKGILKLDEARMRGAGLSGAKARAIRDLAARVGRGDLDLKKLPKLSDAGVLEALTAVKGIGPWTAEMILMFSLGREDIFSHGDLGLRKGLMRLYGFRKPPGEKRLRAIVSKWSPYRTYAARILWKIADGPAKGKPQ